MHELHSCILVFNWNINNYTNKPIFLIEASNILSKLQESNINAMWQSDRLKDFITRNSGKDTFVTWETQKQWCEWVPGKVLLFLNHSTSIGPYDRTSSVDTKKILPVMFWVQSSKALLELRYDQLLLFVDCCMQLDTWLWLQCHDMHSCHVMWQRNIILLEMLKSSAWCNKFVKYLWFLYWPASPSLK